MRTDVLLKGVAIAKIYGELPEEINFVTDNSAKVVIGSLFICRKGNNGKGEDYIAESIKNGAALIMGETAEECSACFIEVKDVRSAIIAVLNNFYDCPQNGLDIIGIVGTNGKTSTCHILSGIFSHSGIKTGRIGTIGNYIGDEKLQTNLTTPGIFELYELMDKMRSSGVKVLIMEVSAHAIAQKRTEGIYFDALIFTNCTEDHLDYFSDMETYLAVKRSIFYHDFAKYFIVNTDDELGRTIYRETDSDIFTYGIDNPADVFAIDVKESADGLKYVLNAMDYVAEIDSKLIGSFNVYNSLAAVTCAVIMGIDIKNAAETLCETEPIEGRMELVAKYNGGYVFVDYAHTPDGLEKMLVSLKKICRAKLICVFGCGGNREKEKRRIMGKIAGKIADFTIITDDNPRYELPEVIRREIEYGVIAEDGDYVNIGDRYSALRYALENIGENDIAVIAGKGAETYQEINGVKHDFSDKETIIQIIGELRGNA